MSQYLDIYGSYSTFLSYFQFQFLETQVCALKSYKAPDKLEFWWYKSEIILQKHIL